MKPHRVISAFRHAGQLIEPPGMWTPPTQAHADRLIKAKCLRAQTAADTAVVVAVDPTAVEAWMEGGVLVGAAVSESGMVPLAVAGEGVEAHPELAMELPAVGTVAASEAPGPQAGESAKGKRTKRSRK